jgi:pimeloyl-ACP methyl ester carboxylesterase
MASMGKHMTTRRTVLMGAVGTAVIATSSNSPGAQVVPRTFVLVHGGFGGGWVWRRVSDSLQKRGHKVFTPTLTGLGERSHLLNAQVNLAMHIADVVNVMRWERLENVVLVGHSYGGMVISGVAEEMERAIASIVFLDAFLPEDNQSAVDFVVLPQMRRAMENRDVAVPPAPAQVFNVNEADRAWVDAMHTPHPLATITDRVRQTGARERIARKAYVLATQPRPSPVMRTAYAKVQAAGDWRTYEVPCGHFVMLDMPERLVEILLET